MSICFADTAYFIAHLNPKDVLHEEAKTLSASLHRGFVTTTWVLVEVGGAMTTPQGRKLFADFVDYLHASKHVTVVPVTENAFRDGLHLFRERLDKAWSMVDCISFNVMRDLGLQQALTADKHFSQAGFEVLLKKES